MGGRNLTFPLWFDDVFPEGLSKYIYTHILHSPNTEYSIILERLLGVVNSIYTGAGCSVGRGDEKRRETEPRVTGEKLLKSNINQ